MKRLYLIGGPMGVGKTTVGQLLKRRLPRCVYLDGDWCWDMDPFQVTDATRAMVLDNISALLRNFLACPDLENVVFAWVMHQQAILDRLRESLADTEAEWTALSLVCTPAELRARLERDVAAGLRQADVIPRSLAYLPLYDALDTRKLSVTGLTPEETARAILQL